MGAWAAIKRTASVYVANTDPLAAASNAGAFLVWSSQPLYPLYVWFLVGRDAWPALLTWLSTPLFFAAPLVARRSSVAGRAWFVAIGVFNTLVSLVAFGPRAGIVWFLVPCLILAIAFFRPREWTIALPLLLLVAAAAAVHARMGPGLVAYDASESRSLSHLNMWSAGGLSIYLIYAAFRARRTKPI